MVDLVFEDPPEHRPEVYTDGDAIKKNADRDQVVAALIQHPGRWAIVSRHLSRSRATQVARVLRGRHPPPYEFRSSTDHRGAGVVYGRYGVPDANIWVDGDN